MVESRIRSVGVSLRDESILLLLGELISLCVMSTLGAGIFIQAKPIWFTGYCSLAIPYWGAYITLFVYYTDTLCLIGDLDTLILRIARCADVVRKLTYVGCFVRCLNP